MSADATNTPVSEVASQGGGSPKPWSSEYTVPYFCDPNYAVGEERWLPDPEDHSVYRPTFNRRVRVIAREDIGTGYRYRVVAAP